MGRNSLGARPFPVGHASADSRRILGQLALDRRRERKPSARNLVASVKHPNVALQGAKLNLGLGLLPVHVGRVALSARHVLGDGSERLLIRNVAVHVNGVHLTVLGGHLAAAKHHGGLCFGNAHLELGKLRAGMHFLGRSNRLGRGGCALGKDAGRRRQQQGHREVRRLEPALEANQQQRKHAQREQGSRNQSANNHGRERLLDFSTRRRREGHGHKPERGHGGGHHHCP